MIPRVYYLSFYQPIGGFVFPDELPSDYYAPGVFVVEENVTGELAYSYDFDAMDNGQRVTLSMVRHNEASRNSILYAVSTKFYGSFWFSLEKVNQRTVRYRGKRPAMQSHGELRIAVTRDSNKLERICERFSFYFIGTTLRDEPLMPLTDKT
ncbi:hypothetical protein [Cupriavidus sp. amp6]|uniref:hypothetical protein n=1 Tax=Cupriavidus sp. amp6 TaxID=388051 RepID=UPI0004911903|nr:hypothetical protein [Cupriavidus sp. amp6]